jgi:hypothetical protein
MTALGEPRAKKNGSRPKTRLADEGSSRKANSRKDADLPRTWAVEAQACCWQAEVGGRKGPAGSHTPGGLRVTGCRGR